MSDELLNRLKSIAELMEDEGIGRGDWCDAPTVREAVAEISRMRKREQEWADCIERLASAGYRLMQLAGGADIETGEMQFACKEGMFSEEIAGQRIKALLRKAKS